MSAPAVRTPGHALSAAVNRTVSQERNLLFPEGVLEDLDTPTRPAVTDPPRGHWLAHMREAIGDTTWPGSDPGMVG